MTGIGDIGSIEQAAMLGRLRAGAPRMSDEDRQALDFRLPRKEDGSYDLDTAYRTYDRREIDGMGPEGFEILQRAAELRRRGFAEQDLPIQYQEARKFYSTKVLPEMLGDARKRAEITNAPVLEQAASNTWQMMEPLVTAPMQIGSDLYFGAGRLLGANNQTMNEMFGTGAGTESPDIGIYLEALSRQWAGGDERPMESIYQDILAERQVARETSKVFDIAEQATGMAGDIRAMFNPNSLLGGMFGKVGEGATKAVAKFTASGKAQWLGGAVGQGLAFGAVGGARQSYDPQTGETTGLGPIAEHMATEAMLFPVFVGLSQYASRVATKAMLPGEKQMAEAVEKFAKGNSEQWIEAVSGRVVPRSLDEYRHFWVGKWLKAGMPGYTPSQWKVGKSIVYQALVEGAGFTALDADLWDGLLHGEFTYESFLNLLEKGAVNALAVGALQAPGRIREWKEAQAQNFPPLSPKPLAPGSGSPGYEVPRESAEIAPDVQAMGWRRQDDGAYVRDGRPDLRIEDRYPNDALENKLPAEEGIASIDDAVRHYTLRDSLEGRRRLAGLGVDVTVEGHRAVAADGGYRLYVYRDGVPYTREARGDNVWHRAEDLPVPPREIRPEQVAVVDRMARRLLELPVDEATRRTTTETLRNLVEVPRHMDPAVDAALRLIEPRREAAGRSLFDEIVDASGGRPETVASMLHELAATTAGFKTADKALTDVVAEIQAGQQAADLGVGEGQKGPRPKKPDLPEEPPLPGTQEAMGVGKGKRGPTPKPQDLPKEGGDAPEGGTPEGPAPVEGPPAELKTASKKPKRVSDAVSALRDEARALGIENPPKKLGELRKAVSERREAAAPEASSPFGDLGSVEKGKTPTEMFGSGGDELNRALWDFYWNGSSFGMELDNAINGFSDRSLKEVVRSTGQSMKEIADRLDTAIGKIQTPEGRELVRSSLEEAGPFERKKISDSKVDEHVSGALSRLKTARDVVGKATAPKPAPSIEQAAAQTPHFGKYGRGLAFISEVWEAMGKPGTLEQFKRDIYERAKKGEFQVVRADLVEAMPRDVVKASEIKDLHATFHQIRVQPPQQGHENREASTPVPKTATKKSEGLSPLEKAVESGYRRGSEGAAGFAAQDPALHSLRQGKGIPTAKDLRAALRAVRRAEALPQGPGRMQALHEAEAEHGARSVTEVLDRAAFASAYAKHFGHEALSTEDIATIGRASEQGQLYGGVPIPLVGEAGKQLAEWMAASGRAIDRVYAQPLYAEAKEHSTPELGVEVGDRAKRAVDLANKIEGEKLNRQVLRIQRKTTGTKKNRPAVEELEQDFEPLTNRDLDGDGKSGYAVSKVLASADGVADVALGDAARKVVDDMLKLSETIAKEVDRTGMWIQLSDKEWVPFTAIPGMRRLPRVYTDVGRAIVLGADTVARDVLARAVADIPQNKLDFEAAKKVLEGIAADWSETAGRQLAMEGRDAREHSREIRVMPDTLIVNGRTLRILETHPFDYAQAAARRTASRIAYVTEFGQRVPKAAVDAYKAKHPTAKEPPKVPTVKVNGKDVPLFQAYFDAARNQRAAGEYLTKLSRSLNDLPIDRPLADTVSLHGRVLWNVLRPARAAWQATKLSGVRTVLANIAEPAGVLSIYVGNARAARAAAEVYGALFRGMAGDRAAFQALAEAAADANAHIARPIQIPTFRAGDRAESVAKIASIISRPQQLANWMNEIVAVRAGRMMADSFLDGTARATDIEAMRWLDLPSDVTARLESGKGTADDAAMIVRKMAAKTQGTGRQAEMSGKQQSRWFRELFPFQTYIRNYWHNNAKLLQLPAEMIEAGQKGDWTAVKAKGNMLRRGLQSKATHSVLTLTSVNLAMYGLDALGLVDADNVKQVAENFLGEWADYLFWNELAGPIVSQVIRSAETGQDIGSTFFQSHPIGSLVNELWNAMPFGGGPRGQYASEDAGDMILRFFRRQVPLVNDVLKWSDAPADVRVALQRYYRFLDDKGKAPGDRRPGYSPFTATMRDFRDAFRSGGADRETRSSDDLKDMLRKAVGLGRKGRESVAGSLASMRLLKELDRAEVRELRDQIGSEQFDILREHDLAIERWIKWIR